MLSFRVTFSYYALIGKKIEVSDAYDYVIF